MDLVEPLNRSLVRLEGLTRALGDEFLRHQIESELTDVGTHVAGLLAANRLLEDQNRCLLHLSRRDELTELYNHRHFMERLDEEFRRAIRYGSPLSVLIADLDDFKAFNDARGHLVGNQLLRRIARIIRQTVRETDLPARYGGDEFAVLLPQTGEDDALRLGERIQNAISALSESVGTSIGVAAVTSSVTGCLDLLSVADRAMYRAKAQGKNRVVRGSTSSWKSGTSLSV